MSDLYNRLAFLASNDSNEISNPFDTEIKSVSSTSIDDTDDDEFLPISIENYLKTSNKKAKQNKKKNKSLFKDLDDIDNYIEKDKKFGDELFSAFEQLKEMDLIEASDDFDDYLENRFEDEENIELRNSLISLGRKYARDTASTAEENEIAQAYLPNEKKLKELFDEIEGDKDSIQKDIEQMRLSRSRNFKTLSELTETKNSYINTQLSIIKEINSMKKHQFDLKYKEAKLNPQTEEDTDITNNTIKALFSMSKSSLLDSMGGYDDISGGNITEDEYYDDDEAYNHYVLNKDKSDSDSDNDDMRDSSYLNYEGRDISYVLLVNGENDVQDVIAEDENGNRIYDYPMPTDISTLDFDIDAKTGIAHDNYHREYKVRII